MERRPLWLWALGALWAVFVVCALLALWAYDHTPGGAGRSPTQWSVGTSLSRGVDQPTLVLFAHPQCLCRRASLGELAETLTGAERQPKTCVAFLKPFGITGARGYTGDNAGRASLLALLNRGTTERPWTSVFGCGLFSASS